jgi:hypothetical protein
VNAPVTTYFDPTKDTEISVDASPVGLDAILSQVDGKTGTHHIVTYASCSLSETEQRRRLGLRTSSSVHIRKACDNLY